MHSLSVGQAKWNLGALLSCATAGCAPPDGDLHFGAMLLRTTVLLALVCGLAIVTLRLAARHGIGVAAKPEGSRRLQLLDELVLGPRQSVVALKAGSRVLIVARTATGVSPLGEMSEGAWKGLSFADVLAEVDGPEHPEGHVDGAELVA